MRSTRLLSFPTRGLPIAVAHGAITNGAITIVQERGFVRNIDVQDVGHTKVSVPILTRAMMSTNSIVRIMNAERRIRTTTGHLKCVSHPAGRASVVFMNLNVLIKNLFKTLSIRVNNVPVDLDADNNTLVTNLFFN